MFWSIGAAAGISALQGLFRLGQEQKYSIEQNKNIMEYNKNVTLSLAQTMSQLSLQRQANAEQLDNTMFSMDAATNANKAKSQIGFSATQTTGASVKDAVSTVNVQKSLGQGNAITQYLDMNEGFNLMASKAAQQSIWSMKKPVEVQGSPLDALVGGIGAGLNQWMMLDARG